MPEIITYKWSTWRDEQVRQLDLLYDNGWLTDAEYNRRIDELYIVEGMKNED